jgi:hypothetical protein
VAEGQYPFEYAMKLTDPSMTSVQSAGDKGVDYSGVTTSTTCDCGVWR